MELPRINRTATGLKTGGSSVSVTSAAASKGRRAHLRTRSAIGIDVGARAVKAVQFGRDRFGSGEWRVAAVAEVPRDEVSQQANVTAPVAGQPGAQPGRAAHALTPVEVRRLMGTLERQGFAGHGVVLAVPNERVLSSLLELPPRSSQAPLEQIARMEVARAHRFAPDAFEMGCWDLPAAARATKQTPVMAVACTHADAAMLMDPFEAEGMDVCALDVKAAALARACRPLLNTEAGGIVGIVDLGWSAATLSLMHRGVAIYGRTLGDSGICKLYHTLATRLGLEIEVIDYLLADSGIAGTDAGHAAQGAVASATTGIRKAKAATDAAGLIAAHFEAAVHELQVSLTYAQHQYPDTPLSRLLVVGGGGCIRGVTEHLRRTLGIEARAAAPADLALCPPAVAEKCASPSLTAALGLAQFDPLM
jgi:Tfp pilus assembly PilM family ATPase